MTWGDLARRNFYIDRYGEEDGQRRYDEWIAKKGISAETATEPKQQEGSIYVEEPNPKPKRTRTATTRSRAKKAEPLEFDDAKAVISVIIAGGDKLGEMVSPTWAKVPRLTGGDEIIARYLDALTNSDQPEVDRLASALAEAYGENQWLAKVFRAAQKYGTKTAPFVKLAAACLSIFLPRLLALGLIPNPFGEVPPNDPNMEGGGTHGTSGDDGEREISIDELSSGSMPEAVYRTEEQSGQREIPASTNGHQSVGDIASESRPMGTAPIFHGSA